MTVSVDKNLEILSEEDFSNPRIIFSLLKYLEDTRYETDFDDYYLFILNALGLFEFVGFLLENNILKDAENLANLTNTAYNQSPNCKILYFLDKIKFDGENLKEIKNVLISHYIAQNRTLRTWLFTKFTEIKKYYDSSYTFLHTLLKEITEEEWRKLKKFKVHDSKYRTNKINFKLI